MTENLEGATLVSADYSAGLSNTVVPGLLSADTTSEENLAKRYSRFTKKKEELVYEFTRDPALIHQYYRIYEEEFKAVLDAEYHHNSADEHDQRGHFLIVRRGKLCIGGARISVKTPRQPNLLPVEAANFRLEDHFPELRQKEMRVGQAGRFCLLPEFRGGAVTREMQRHITRKAIALNLDMFFATAPLLNARVYKQNCVALGFKDVKIHFDIQLPEYPMCEEVKFYLISGVIDNTLVKSFDLSAEELAQQKNSAIDA
jgi:hypothetical protein